MSRLPEPMRRRMEELNSRTAAETVRAFMLGHFAGAQTLNEVREDFRNVASFGTTALERDLGALDEILATSQPEGYLAELVGWVGNWVLEDPSDEGARAFLVEVADMLREIIAEAPPAAARRARRRG